jgi:hypothetical protein
MPLQRVVVVLTLSLLLSQQLPKPNSCANTEFGIIGTANISHTPQ